METQSQKPRRVRDTATLLARRGGIVETVLPIANVLGAVIMAVSATMLAPLVVAISSSHDAALPAFGRASAIGVAAGAITWALTQPAGVRA